MNRLGRVSLSIALVQDEAGAAAGDEPELKDEDIEAMEVEEAANLAQVRSLHVSRG